VLTKKKYESWELDDFLGFFETIWSFNKKRLIDQDITYDLFSDLLISAYEANDFALEKIIKDFRKEPKKGDYYIGVFELYKEMKKRENK
jgi:hypothetical protein